VTPPALLQGILGDGQELRPVGDDIWSTLPGDAHGQRYDRRARLYDALVGSPAYNRLAWGSAPRSYSAFAERAVRSADGPFLDAGCGSLLFTANGYARARRPLLLVDLARVASAGGQMFLSSLVAESWRGTRHLHLLHAAGEVARPRTLRQLLEELEGANAFTPPIEVASEGCMSFIRGRIRQPSAR